MAALNFPSSPNVNDTYTANGKSWKLDGVSWVSSNFLLTDPKITLGGTYGTSGQVMTSQGNGVPPAWGSTITALKEVKSVIGASDIDLRSLSSADDEAGPAIATDSGGNMFFICSATAPLATSVLTTKLPTDGSMTGTHAPYTYATLTLSESAGTLTSTTASVPGSTPSFTSTNGALVASGASLVPTTIEVA